VMDVCSRGVLNLPRTSGAQAGGGTAVPSLAEAQPGDISANANHAAIYIGNGMIVNALTPAQGTQVTNLSAFGGAASSIRRVLCPRLILSR
ncbi:peptidase P60, partial [Bifidobacterium animalis subsp. lactis]|uniref:C40 family peptidase n=1 Tax=Bifidobacterium animalis TaxID=28025 RepID=UPI000DE6DCF2